MRCLTSSVGKKRGGVLVVRHNHDGSPICHLRAFIHNRCGGNSTLAAWEVASCAQTAHGSPATGRSNISVICKVHSGARSREGVVRRPLRAHGGATSRWAGPGTTWKSNAAPNRGTVRRPANLFPCVREFLEVILLHPREAQRHNFWIALGNREFRCTMACSAPSGGSSLQRVISSTHGHHRLAHLRVY